MNIDLEVQFYFALCNNHIETQDVTSNSVNYWIIHKTNQMKDLVIFEKKWKSQNHYEQDVLVLEYKLSFASFIPKETNWHILMYFILLNSRLNIVVSFTVVHDLNM